MSVTELIETAERDVWLLSPFVDDSGLAEVEPALGRAIKRGVRVLIMTRHLGDPKSPNSRLIERLRGCGLGDGRTLRAHHLIIGTGRGRTRELLHAKVIVTDEGRQGYVGSLNLTGSSLDDVFEIGVIVGGSTALSLAQLIRDLIRASEGTAANGGMA